MWENLDQPITAELCMKNTASDASGENKAQSKSS